MTHVWSMLQGLVEHGALVGGQGVAGAPHGSGAQQITAWAADHRVALLATLAVLLLLGLIRASHRP